MARNPFLFPALAAGLIFAASPLASATVAAPPSVGGTTVETPMCGERDAVVAELKQVFQETPMAVGQVDGNAIMEILVSEAGSWTILATGTDGVSCIVSAGEGFEGITPSRDLDV